ncbi:MAG: hypothetical protein V4601_08160 [Pseudomonadota bacterium]
MFTPSEWVQIISTVATTAGVLVSLFIGVRTVLEQRRQREQAIKPFLLFDIGGYGVPIEFRDSSAIPGIQLERALQLTKNRPTGANSMSATEEWGVLRNHGQGPALEVRVIFRAYRVFTSFGCRVLEKAERKAFPYSPSLNNVPPTPSNISPAAAGSFRRLPTPLVVDYDHALKRIDFVVEIRCKDTLGNPHVRYQGLRVFADNMPGKITTTFIEEVFPPNVPWSIFGTPESGDFQMETETD